MATILPPAELKKLPPWILDDCRKQALRQQLAEKGRLEPSYRLTLGLVREALKSMQMERNGPRED